MSEDPQHPGALLLAALEAMSMTQANLARLTGLSTKHVNQVCTGKAGIGAQMAVRLEDVTGVTAARWMAAQAAHDIAEERKLHVPNVDRQEQARQAVERILSGQDE